MIAARDRRETTPLFEPPHLAADSIRYGSAMALVAATFAAIAFAIGHAPVYPEASETDSAVMVELPPAETSSQPASKAAAAAPPAAAQPAQVEEAQKPPDTPQPEPPKEVPKTPPAPQPAVPIERTAEPQKPAVTPPPSAAQAAQAPAEAVTHADIDDSSGDEGTPHASAQKITLWQKALMKRLEAAKRAHRRAVAAAGTVKVAFEIDRRGDIHAAHVATSSGSAALDGAAIALVKDASPFPAPPVGAGAKDMSFIVPIHFRR